MDFPGTYMLQKYFHHWKIFCGTLREIFMNENVKGFPMRTLTYWKSKYYNGIMLRVNINLFTLKTSLIHKHCCFSSSSTGNLCLGNFELTELFLLCSIYRYRGLKVLGPKGANRRGAKGAESPLSRSKLRKKISSFNF